MAKGEDLVKYIAQQVTQYLDTPKEVRKQERGARGKEEWQRRWFGMLPFALKMWRDGRRKKRETPPPRS